MDLTVGTFNLQNLFSRFNFSSVIDELPADEAMVTETFRVGDDDVRIRAFDGRLIRAKPERDIDRLADRISRIDVDVLAVQEVENVEALREFNQTRLGAMYRHAVLIEGNDERFIDVAVLSKLPLRRITSHQTEIHPLDPTTPVFRRDLLSVEVWSPTRSRRLLTMYVNHLKSAFVPFDADDPDQVQRDNDELRRRQTETVARIVDEDQRPRSRFIVLGDLNAVPDSPTLAPLFRRLPLFDGLADVDETQPLRPEATGPGPSTPRWTFRRKPSGQAPEYLLLDQIWLSESLNERLVSATIDRRTLFGGDGSDHDPAWVTLTGL